MARALRSEPITSVDWLRESLAEAEALAGKGRDSCEATLALLRQLDRTEALWTEFAGSGADLRPESARWTALQARVRRHAGDIANALRPAGGLPTLRATCADPDHPAWWWQLDLQRRNWARRRVGRLAAVLAISVLAVAVSVHFLGRLFPRDAVASAALMHLDRGQTAVQDRGDLRGALSEFEQAASLNPRSVESWLWLGATQQRLGDQPGADESYARAAAVAQSGLQFHLARAPVAYMAGLPDVVRSDVLAALALDQGNPEAYFYLSMLDEKEGRTADAIANLQRASDQADERGLFEVGATARLRKALLMGRVQPQFP